MSSSSSPACASTPPTTAPTSAPTAPKTARAGASSTTSPPGRTGLCVTRRGCKRHAYKHTQGCIMVYMARTNIEIDEELVGRAMRVYRLRSKREAVDLALRRLVGEPMDREEALAMEGRG